MKRLIFRWAALLQIGLVLFTGCHPTQPFFVGEDGDLSHYLQTATQIEYPDLQVESIPEATQAIEPYMVGNSDFEYWDVTLEECIAYALANSKLVRSVPGTSQITQDIATQILSSPSAQLRTALDPAIASSTANTQPLVIDQNGNRTLPRGAIRSNQVGGIEDALSEFDAQYSSFLAFNTTDRQRNAANIFTPAFFTARDTTYQSALSKRFATGGVATARMQTIYSANNVPTVGGTARVVPSDYTQILEVQIQHPLARGRGTMVNRIPVMLARINEDLSTGQFEEGVRNLVKEVENAYWDLYCAYWNVETAKLGRDGALRLYRNQSARSDVGLTPPAGFYQAKAQAQQFEAQLNAALYGVNLPGGDIGVLGRERKLRAFLGLAPTDGRVMRPVDRPTVARTDFDWQTIHGEALCRNLELRQHKWGIKQKELELISAKNQILPEVNVSGLYRWLGTGDDLWSRDGGDTFPGNAGSTNRTSAWESLLDGNFQEVGVRLELIPNAIGARRAHALIRNAQLSIAREHAILQDKELMLVHSLSDSFALLNNTYQQIQIKLNELHDREMDAKLQTVRFVENADKDRNTEDLLNFLLQAQERQARAQQEYYRAVCEYNKLIVHIHLLKGSLLDYNNIALGEGPWADKAYWDATERARERDAALFLEYGSSRPAVISRGPVEHQYQGGVSNEMMVGEGIQNDSPALESTMPQKSTPAPKQSTEPESTPVPEEVKPVPNPQASPKRSLLKSEQATTSITPSNLPIAKPSNEGSALQWNARAAKGSIGSEEANPLRLEGSSVQQASHQVPVSSSGQAIEKRIPMNSLRR